MNSTVRWTVTEWEAAYVSATPVAECRRCGGSMLAEPPVQVGAVVFLDARCATCGQETSAPEGRVHQSESYEPVRPAPAWFRQARRERDPDWAERAAGAR